ncbi:cell adhesion molecule-related/down-regulated by oncogenes-like isoform X1 [Watersipora subatra]|uniref:cell adhesion molecule-related/down-regulated by oncogenes-like isoform X1 n=1 Tax=Watersipora subatra TaxID=2589382 RepID=UPI00355B4A27
MDCTSSLLTTLAVTILLPSELLAQLPIIQSDTIDGAVKVKSSVTLRCVSSEPNSPVTWTRNDVVIESANEMGITFNGSSMTIDQFRASSNNVNSQDGDWRCVSGSLVSKKLTLSKAKIKSFPSSAKDVAVAAFEGTSALIPCQPPTSNPRADTVFEHSGATIDESRDRFTLLSSGDLLISDLQISDSGEYVCVAINRVLGRKITAGYVVRLDVQANTQPASAPEFQYWSSGQEVNVEEGTDLLLPCAVNSNPKAEISWDRYPSQMPQNRSQQVHDSLLLEDLRGSDSGTYNCQADYETNPAPFTLTYVVNVLTYPQANFRSREFNADEGHEVVIICRVDSGDNSNNVIKNWYKDGSLLTSDPDLGVALGEAGLTLSNVSQSSAGMYQCTASNDVGEDTAYMKLRVQKPPPPTTTTTTTPTTTTLAIQPSPENVRVEQIRRTGFKITWSIDPDADVLSYQIKMREGKGNWKTVSWDIAKQASSQEVHNDLVSGKKYKFAVVAVYRLGVRVESEPTHKITLDPTFGEDETTPANTHTEYNATLSSDTLSTTAQAPACSSQCPPIVITALSNMTRPASDIVKWRCQGIVGDISYTWYKDGVLLDRVPGDIAMNDGLLWLSYARTQDTAWYTCQISNQYGAVNTSAYLNIIGSLSQPSVDLTPFTTTARARQPSRENVIVPPTAPMLRPISPTELIVEWQPISAGVSVRLYQIQLRQLHKQRSDWETVPTLGNQDDTSYKVSKLQPGATYKVRLAAIYENSKVSYSDSVRVSLPEANKGSRSSPRTSPRVFSVVQQGDGVLLVQWTYATAIPISMFIVQYQVDERVAQGWLEKKVEVKTSTEMDFNQARLRNLEDNAFYVVRVLAVNEYGRGPHGNAFRRQVVYPYENFRAAVDPTEAGSDADETYTNPVKLGDGQMWSDDMLYIILASVLGSMVLLLIVFVSICGFKQRQRRRAMLSMSSRSHNKFADASKVLYGDQLKQQPHNGLSLQFVTQGENASAPPQSNGTISSLNSQRMSLNINPLNELDGNPGGTVNGGIPEPIREHTNQDYNLMQHYPHYNSNGSRRTPTYHHNSHQSIEAASQHDNSTHGSLPHYNVHQQYDPVRSTTPQFSTFLPCPARETSPSPLPITGKLPHPQGLRPIHYAQSPVSSACEGSQGSQQRRRRKKRSQHNRDHLLHQSNSNAGSAKEYNTNTDLSSGEGTGLEEYNHALPPPPMLPSSYSQVADTLDSNMADHL